MPLPSPTPLTALRLCATALACALLAACGGSSGGGGPVASSPTNPTNPTTPTTPPPTDGAASCLNPALYNRQGTVAVLRYQVAAAGGNSNATYLHTVEPAETFDGQTANKVLVRETLHGTAGNDTQYSATQYFRVDASSVQLLGSTTAMRRNATPTVRTVRLSPGQAELDTTLASGAIRSGSTTIHSSYAPAVGSATPVAATTQLRFDGFENVTVPAGSFTNTCRYTVTLTTSATRQSTRWIARGSGVVVRSQSGSEVRELVSGTINGQAIAP